MKQLQSQSGHIHLAAVLVVVLTFIGVIGYGVYAQQQSSKQSSIINVDETSAAAATSSAKDKKAKREAKKKVKQQQRGKGTVQVTTKELVVTKSGKRKIVKRGNVLVKITSVNPKASCRDDGKHIPRSKRTGQVFQGKSNPRKGSNLGKIKVDKCSIGTYTLRLSLSPDYEVLENPGKFDVNPRKTTKLSVVIASKVATPNGSSPGGAGPAVTGQPGGVNPIDGAPLPRQPSAPTREECMRILKWYYIDSNQDASTTAVTDSTVETCETRYPDLIEWIDELQGPSTPPLPEEPEEPEEDPGLLPEDAVYGR